MSQLPGTSVASASASVAGIPLHQLPVSRLLVPKLPVPLPRLPVSAGALIGVQVLCHGQVHACPHHRLAFPGEMAVV